MDGLEADQSGESVPDSHTEACEIYANGKNALSRLWRRVERCMSDVYPLPFVVATVEGVQV